jgi:hypothetical protein
VDGVRSPVETNSSTAWPTAVWKEELPRIIIVGKVGLPIAAVLLSGPSSIPPKQYESEQTAWEVCQDIRKSHPVPFCLAAKVIPELGSFMVAVSDHWEAEYALLTLTGIVDWYAVIVVGAACTVLIENDEASTAKTRRTESAVTLTLDLLVNSGPSSSLCSRD